MTPTFSAQTDPVATSVVAVITLVFGALMYRANLVKSAAESRREAATTLRTAREEVTAQQQLMRVKSISGGNSEDLKRMEQESIELSIAATNAEQSYRIALDIEGQLRDILPGIRVISPDAPAAEMEREIRELLPDMRASEEKDHMGEFEDSMDLKPGFSTERRDKRNVSDQGKPEDSEQQMSPGKVLVLVTVALSQILLLVMLSFDPMKASPFSSWY
eukprot:CAMPEP_0113314944 /NCGR_PEP_ID=MMETSP0010_2-20120614/10800_1 /TAXON_ID=216773 ORGANISM="Corethron hystrix, Strain 308" /NCGR_SAMPLE_ID=MMETSP0010_2 /ASSEMBLY_ACC=CAM_ASM_000155 /LENGTH=217 /DNA_ID=CAMNT_0000171327 /DNA_START=447 /DNA_END=1100 /DNA_ORIENTATION=- /assembly_acc=CAM_ASM_000155